MFVNVNIKQSFPTTLLSNISLNWCFFQRQNWKFTVTCKLIYSVRRQVKQ